MALSDDDQHMLAEILHQPEAWAATLGLVQAKASEVRRLAQDVHEVIFTGCGSGLNASMAIAPTFQALTGVRARAVPAAEIVFFPETVFVARSRYLVVPLSRSGATSEVVQACDLARRRDMPVLGITCDADSPLAQRSTLALVLEAASEVAVTTTQSLSSMILCGQQLSGVVAGDTAYLDHLRRLPALGRSMLETCHRLGRRIAEDDTLTRFAFVGSGSLQGVAREGQLKVKEMVLLPSDSYPMLDFRHGPKSNVDRHMLITLLSCDRTQRVEVEFMAEMKGLGGRLLVICERAAPEVRALADYLVELESGLPDLARDVLYLPPIHFMAFYKALAQGQHPSTPPNLSYWVETRQLQE